MAEIEVSQLSPSLRKSAAQARTALAQGNYDYVLEVSKQILKVAPECLAVRLSLIHI